MSTRPATPSPGDVLAGKYRVERVIGQGGMGVVVAATHLQLDQLVALKFTTLDGGPAVERFLREARSAVRLRSEHVAKVTDVGTLENGTPYMVMEYLEGQDLSVVLREKGQLPVSDAVGYVVQACEAVAEAHGLGIVHRDLKPHNLFLTTGVSGLPKVKVLDFGISKTLGTDLALTRTAEIVGTPSYMSPEQLRSARDVDQRADIWALGVILYELVTGRLPFEAETLPQLCTMVATETPAAPIVHRPDLPQAISDAVLRCLVRAPEARFPDAAELAAALGPFVPDWASAQRVHLVSKSSSSGRRVVSLAPPGKGSATDAAWSETELAPRRSPPLWSRRAARIAVAAVPIVGALGLGLRIGSHRPVSAPPPPAAPVVTAAVAPQPQPPAPPPAPPTPPAAPATPPPDPVATASSVVPLRASPSATAAGKPAPRASSPSPSKPKTAATPTPSPTSDDSSAYERRQ